MAKLVQASSTTMYSWWWNSHISPKNSKWLEENLTDMDRNVKAMIKLIEEDADSFRKRAEMYYRKRPELMKLVEEFYRAYRALAERYDHATGALRQAHKTMAEAFPDQVPLELTDESPSGSEIFGMGQEAIHAEEVLHLLEENQRLKNQITSELERANNAQASFDTMKGEKEAVLLQCHISQEQISSLEAELSRTQEDLKKINDEFLLNTSNLSEENQRLKDQIASETQRADNAQADIDRLKCTLSQLESEKEATSLECQIFQFRIYSLETELSRTKEDFKKRNDEFVLNMGKLSEENQRLKDQIASESWHADSLRGTISQLESDKEATLLQCQLHRVRISFLEAELSRTEEDMKKHNEDYLLKATSLSDEVQRLKSQSTSESARADNAEANVDSLKGTISKLESDKEAVFLQSRRFQERVSSLQAELSRTNEDMKKHTEEYLLNVTNFSEEIQKLKNHTVSESQRADNAQAECQLFKNRICSLESELSRAQEDLKKLNEDYLLTAGNSSNEIQRLKNQITCEAERADNAQADVENLKGTILQLKAEEEATSLECQLFQDRIFCLEAELSLAKEDMKKLKGTISEEKKGLKGTISKLESDKHDALLQCQLSRDQISSLQAELSQTKEDCNKLHDETSLNITNLSNENQKLRNQIASEAVRADSALADADSMKERLSKVESDKEAVVLQCKILQERIFSLEAEHSRTQEELKKLNDELLSNITNLKSLEEQHRLLEEENQSLQFELNMRHDELEKLDRSIEDEKQRTLQVEMAFLSLEELHSRSQEELKNMEATKAGLEEELKGLKEEIGSLKEENFSFSFNIMNLQDEANILNESKRSLEEEIERYVDENGALKEENFSSSLKILNLQDEISSMKEDKVHLEQRHDELTQQIQAVTLNVESLQQLIMELKEMCKIHEDEKSVHLGNLKRMEKISETNATLENSLSNANVELDELREKVKILEKECEALKAKITMHVSDKATLVSQIVGIAQNMGMLSEKNAMLETSLSDANVELEGSRRKLTSLEEVYQSLHARESNLLSEKNNLVTQVESISRSLEDAESGHSEVKCRNVNLEKEKESMLHQIIDLQASLKMEKEVHETLMQFTKNQLATLENDMNLLEEEGWHREQELEVEHQKLVDVQLENLVLRRCLHDMTEKSTNLLDTCQKNIEMSGAKDKTISELEKECYELKQNLTALSQDNDNLLEVIHQVKNLLDINNERHCCYLHFELILSKIKDLKASLSNAQHDKQQQILEKSIFVTFLEQSKVDMTNVVSEKNAIEREFRLKCEETTGLREAHSRLQNEIFKFRAENKSLSDKLHSMHHENDTLEEEINGLHQELITAHCLCTTFRSYIAELEDDVISTKTVCGELTTQVETGKKLLVQKDTELLQASRNIEVLQDKNSKLCRNLEQLRQQLVHSRKEVQELKSSRTDEAKLCEAEMTALLIDSQMSAINAAVYEEKMHELLLTCESLELSATTHREKLYEELTLRVLFEDELNKKLEALISENTCLKEELSAYMPLVMSLHDDIASLEECILLPTKRRSFSFNHRQKQDQKLTPLQHEKNNNKRNTVHRAMPDITSELKKMHVKINSLQSVLLDTMNHIEQEKSSSNANLHDAMRKISGLKPKANTCQDKPVPNKDIVLILKNNEEKKPKENYDQIVKDIQLDHELSSLRYDDGASSQSAETKFEIMELWDTAESKNRADRDLDCNQVEEVVDETKKPILPKIITRSHQDWNGNLNERLSSDGHRLSLLQKSMKELKRNLDNSPKSEDFDKIRAQLKDAEKTILHLTSVNGKMKRRADSFSASSESLVSDHTDDSERRERRVAERAKRSSEKIGKLELELQKIQYILLKLKEEEEFKRERVVERRSRVVLRDYLYGKNTPRRKKVQCCACVRPKTKE